MLKHLATACCIVAATVVPVVAATGDSESHTNKGIRYYPGFTKPDAVVEVVHDKGLTVELIIRCPAGTGIISWSKVEKLYCMPDQSCTPNLNAAIRDLCR